MHVNHRPFLFVLTLLACLHSNFSLFFFPLLIVNCIHSELSTFPWIYRKTSLVFPSSLYLHIYECKRFINPLVRLPCSPFTHRHRHRRRCFLLRLCFVLLGQDACTATGQSLWISIWGCSCPHCSTRPPLSKWTASSCRPGT